MTRSTKPMSFRFIIITIGLKRRFRSIREQRMTPCHWNGRRLWKKFKEKGKIVELNIYPGADHNLAGASDSWNLAVQKSLEWFNIY